MKKIKEYVFSLMNDGARGPLHALPKLFLHILSIFYFLCVKFIDVLYFFGIKGVFAVDAPVISIGNITLGGTGKTPFTIFLANLLISKGKKPAVLIRGYGDDEYKLLEEKLGSERVFVGPDRVLSSYYATRKGYDIIILDDAYQHKRLKRNLDIVLLDSARPLGNGFLFPRGVLREPPSALKRADMVIFTKCDYKPDRAAKTDLETGRYFNKKTVTGELVYNAKILRDSSGIDRGIDFIRGKNVLAVSGIVNSGYFIFLVNKCGAGKIDIMAWPDHHNYTAGDVARICNRKENGKFDIVITTEKDYVKLAGLDLSPLGEEIFVLGVDVEITKGKEEIIAGLSRFYSG